MRPDREQGEAAEPEEEGKPLGNAADLGAETSLGTCRVVQAGKTYSGKQGFDYFAGISAQSTGAERLCLHLLTIPPGGRACAHRHENHETAIYVLHGESEMWYGERLQHHLIVRAGDFLYIPAGVAHLPANVSLTEPCTAVIARTDPNEQESVILLPELEEYVPPRESR